MEQILINQNENQEIIINSNTPQLITISNDNLQNINIKTVKNQNIDIKEKGSQILYVEEDGSVKGIDDVIVNGKSVVSKNIAYITVPTKLSELENNEGFIKTEQDPTVPSYVKEISQANINSWNNKQNQLVSGVNIKTLNNESLLGSGNITINEPVYTAGYGIDITGYEVSNTLTSYNDLSDLPTIPTQTSQLENNSNFVTSDELSDVAFSGSYTDLSNAPDIPTDTSDLINDSGFIDKDVNDLTYYTLTSNLSAVATSGDYDDLLNKPSIPTNTSDLNNDSGFISESDYASNLHGGTIKTGVNSYDINSVGQLYADTQTYATYGSMANTNFIGKGTLENVFTGKGFIDNTVNNLTNYTNNTDLSTLFSNLFRVEETVISVGTINAQAGKYDKTHTFTIPTGYNPLGIVGYQLSGANSASITIGRFFIDSNNDLIYSLFNSATSGSSSSSTSLKVYILFYKS